MKEKIKGVLDKYQAAKSEMQSIRDALAVEMVAIDEHIAKAEMAIIDLGEVSFSDMAKITERSNLQASVRMAMEAKILALEAYFAKADDCVKRACGLRYEAMQAEKELRRWKSDIVVDLFNKSEALDIAEFSNSHDMKREIGSAFDEIAEVRSALHAINQIGQYRITPIMIERVWQAFKVDHNLAVIKALKMGF